LADVDGDELGMTDDSPAPGVRRRASRERSHDLARSCDRRRPYSASSTFKLVGAKN